MEIYNNSGNLVPEARRMRINEDASPVIFTMPAELVIANYKIVFFTGFFPKLRTDLDDNLRYIFIYDASYLLGKGNPIIGLMLPLRSELYPSLYLIMFLFNILFEGENYQAQFYMLHINADDDFGIFLAIVQTNTRTVIIKPNAVW